MPNPRVFDDLAQLVGGAMSVASSLRQQMRENVHERADHLASRMDLPTRDELRRLEGMIAKARTVQEEILKRLDALEGKKAKPSTKAAEKTAKPAAKKPAVKPAKKK